MTERIDHAAEAIRLREIAFEARSEQAAANIIASAQVEATLALVEQQRVANLLAATRLVPEGKRPGIDAWGQASDDVLYNRLADDGTWVALLGADGYERWKATW